MPFTNDDLQIEQSIIYPATGYLVSHLISPDARAVPLPWDFLKEMKHRWDSHDELVSALERTLIWMQQCELELGGPIGLGYKGNMHKPVIVELIRSSIAEKS